MKRQRTVVFLYTRLPEYFLRCSEYFTSIYGYRVAVIRYQDDPDTRYSLSSSENIELYYKSDVNIEDLVSRINPDLIVISSWADKEYTTVAAKYVKSIPVVVAIDNPYTGSVKQKILCNLSAITIKRFCNRAWVPGPGQYEYASRLGFSKSNIIQNMYSADTEKFYNAEEQALESKRSSYPKTIVFVGRVVEYKQPDLLAKLFSQLLKEHGLKWKLIIAGEGTLKEFIKSRHYPNVELIDFIAPADLPAFYQRAGIFCLPSKGEHWGLAVHEAASAGLPLLLSDSVESGNTFLINGLNGFSFETSNESSFKNTLFKMMKLRDTDLLAMAENSLMLSRRISHQTWAASLNSLMSETR